MVPLEVAGVSFVGGVHPRLHELLEILWTEGIARGYELKAQPTQTGDLRGEQSVGRLHRAITRPARPLTPTAHSTGLVGPMVGTFRGGLLSCSIDMDFAEEVTTRVGRIRCTGSSWGNRTTQRSLQRKPAPSLGRMT